MAIVTQHMVLSDELAITFIRPKGKRNSGVRACDIWWGQEGHTGTPAYWLLAVTQQHGHAQLQGRMGTVVWLGFRKKASLPWLSQSLPRHDGCIESGQAKTTACPTKTQHLLPLSSRLQIFVLSGF